MSLTASTVALAAIVLLAVSARIPIVMDRDLPARAVNARAGAGSHARAVLDCIVSRTGCLNRAVVQETPSGWGFGAAALQMAADYQMAPATRDGAPIEARYLMRVPFDLD